MSRVCSILLCGCILGGAKFEDLHFNDFCDVGGFCGGFFCLAFLVDMGAFPDIGILDNQKLPLDFLLYLFACGDKFGKSNLIFCCMGLTDMFGNSK